MVTIPDFFVGSILSAFGIERVVGAGLVSVCQLPFSWQLDVFGRGVNTVFIHATKYGGKTKLGCVLSCISACPRDCQGDSVFLTWPGRRYCPTSWVPRGLDGIRTVGAILPALGFALLLGQMAIRKYLPFLIIGYVLFAYLGMSVIGISIVAVAIAVLYMQLKGGAENA